MRTLCSMNYHESRHLLIAQASASGLSIDSLGLGVKCLSLCALAANCTKALDAQLLPSLHHCIEPSLGVLLKQGLALGMLLLGHNPSPLALHQVRLLQACGRLLLNQNNPNDSTKTKVKSARCTVTPGNQALVA